MEVPITPYYIYRVDDLSFFHLYTPKFWNHDFSEYVSWFYVGTVVYWIWSSLMFTINTN